MELTNLVKISFSSNGEVSAIDGNQIYKNSVAVNSIFVLWDGDYTDSLSVVYQKSGVVITNPIALIYSGVSDDGKTIFQKLIPEEVMILEGAIELSFAARNTAGQQLTSGELTLYINNSAIPYTGTGEASGAEELQQQVNVLQGTVDNLTENTTALAQEALETANDAKTLATTASEDSAQAKADASNALSVANGIDGKATQALSNSAAALAVAGRVETLEEDVENVQSDVAELDEKVNALLPLPAAQVTTTARVSTGETQEEFNRFIYENGGGGTVTKFTKTFAESEFVFVSLTGLYHYEVPAATHGLGANVCVAAIQKLTTDNAYEDVFVSSKVWENYDVWIITTEPFTGKIKLD